LFRRPAKEENGYRGLAPPEAALSPLRRQAVRPPRRRRQPPETPSPIAIAKRSREKNEGLEADADEWVAEERRLIGFAHFYSAKKVENHQRMI